MIPTVSIIMPAYQAGIWLGDSVKSVRAQTFENWELIVVDDGSTDNTREVCRQLMQLDPRIRYFYQKNGKQGKARNKGIMEAEGEFLAFLDADDIWLPEKLEKSLELLSTPEYDVVCSGAWEWDGVAELTVCRTKQVQDIVYAGEEGKFLFAKANRVPLLTAVCRRKAVVSIGAFDESLSVSPAEDYDLWIRLLISGSVIRCVTDCSAVYRLHPGGCTYGDHRATISAATVILKNFGRRDFEKTQWVKIRKAWVERLLQRMLIQNRERMKAKELIEGFLPEYRYIVRMLRSRLLFKKNMTRRALSRLSEMM